MYRLLIVDDEQHIVNSLALMFEARDIFDLEIHTTCSSEEAVYLMHTMKVDIVLLDIMMPGLSGIEVFREIQASWPQVQVIFLTGYNSFDFIYQANHIANMQYLLKTEDDEAIVGAVMTAMRAIDEERSQRSLSSRSLWQQQVITHLTQGSVIREFLAGMNATAVAVTERVKSEHFRLDLSRPVYLAHADFRAERDDALMERMINYEQYAEATLNGLFTVALVDLSDASAIMLLQPAGDWQMMISPIDYLREYLNDLVAGGYLSESGIRLFLYGEPVAWDALCVAADLLTHRIATVAESTDEQFGSILDTLEDAQTAPDARQKTPTALINRLNHALGQFDEPTIAEALGELREYCIGARSMHHLSAINTYHSIGSILIGFIETHTLQEALAQRTGLYKLYNINDFSDWNAAFDYLDELTGHIMDLLRRGNNHHLDRLIRVIQEYIIKNIDQPLSLTSIANHVKYNSSYISRLFKQKVGESVSAYITGVRIKRAQELLRNSNESIQNIAQQVGFDSPQYFAIIFKRTVGVTPSDYRNQPGP